MIVKIKAFFSKKLILFSHKFCYQLWDSLLSDRTIVENYMFHKIKQTPCL